MSYKNVTIKIQQTETQRHGYFPGQSGTRMSPFWISGANDDGSGEWWHLEP